MTLQGMECHKYPPCKAWTPIRLINAPAHTHRLAIDCDGYCADSRRDVRRETRRMCVYARCSDHEGWRARNSTVLFSVTEIFWQLIPSPERCPLRFDLNHSKLAGGVVSIEIGRASCRGGTSL